LRSLAWSHSLAEPSAPTFGQVSKRLVKVA
jgi:hypothetical protein